MPCSPASTTRARRTARSGCATPCWARCPRCRDGPAMRWPAGRSRCCRRAIESLAGAARGLGAGGSPRAAGRARPRRDRDRLRGPRAGDLCRGEPGAQAGDRRTEREPGEVRDDRAARGRRARRLDRRTRGAAAPGAVAMMPRAGFVSRMGAFAVDAVVMTLALRGAVWILHAATHVLRRFAPPVNIASLLLAIGPLLAAIYLVAFWTLLGQTPGKILFGLKIVTRGDAPVGFRRSLVRLVG